MGDHVGPSQMDREDDGQEIGDYKSCPTAQGHWVVLTDPQMDGPSGFSHFCVILSSLRITQKLLVHWMTRLSCHGHLLLTYTTSSVVDDEPFPAIFLALDFKDCWSHA